MSHQMNILLIDDDEDDYQITRDVFRRTPVRTHDLQWESTYEGGLAALGRHSSDLCLLDYRLGAKDGLALLAEARESGCTVPIIFLTGKGERETEDKALQYGADDYLAKAELTPAVLERSIRYALERARHVEALRLSEQRYRNIVETALEGVWIIDAKRRTTFVNSQMAAMLGWTRDEMRAAPPGAFMDEETHARIELQRGGAETQHEFRLERRDGSELRVLIHATPMFDSTGRDEGTVAMVTDITQQRRAEATLRCTEEQLRQSQKMEAIGNLAGGVAHDFNNLLSVILSYSGMLAADLPAGDPQRADLEEIELAGRRAVDLTRQLLAFSRQQILQPRIVNLNDIVGSMDKMLQRVIGEDVELTTMTTPTLAKVKVDPGQIEQIIMNLVVNARDAMPQGGTLTIETRDASLDETDAAAHPGVAPGPYVMLVVTDTGTGMDEATLARMFEPFFTTKPTGKGTGLGLATVFGIVKQSGGALWADSVLGQGTTFKVCFPRCDAGAVAEKAATRMAVGAAPDGTETILVVEDEAGVRSLVCRILRRHGYTVLEAGGGVEALRLCQEYPSPIALLLTDVVMPKWSGRQVAERLAPLQPEMKVLYMSGYTDDSIVHHGVLDSDVAFLQKPVTPDRLAHRVREVLGPPPPRKGDGEHHA